LPVAGNRVKILLGKYRERIPLGNKSTDGRMVLKRILQIFSLTVVQFNSLLLKQRIHFTSLYIYIYYLHLDCREFLRFGMSNKLSFYWYT
jgi:hypothetical protein